MIRIASYASPLERVGYYAFRAFCGFVLVFLMLPILVVAPLTVMSTLMLVTLEW